MTPSSSLTHPASPSFELSGLAIGQIDSGQKGVIHCNVCFQDTSCLTRLYDHVLECTGFVNIPLSLHPYQWRHHLVSCSSVYDARPRRKKTFSLLMSETASFVAVAIQRHSFPLSAVSMQVSRVKGSPCCTALRPDHPCGWLSEG